MSVQVVVTPLVPPSMLCGAVRLMLQAAGYTVADQRDGSAEIRSADTVVAEESVPPLKSFLADLAAAGGVSSNVSDFFDTLKRFEPDSSAIASLRSASGFQNEYLAAVALQYALQKAGSDSPVSDFEMLCHGTDDLSRGFVKLITPQAIRTATLKDAGKLLRSAPLPPLPVLRQPLDAETVERLAADAGGIVEALVPFKFMGVFEEEGCAGIYELFLDEVATKVVGAPTLGEITVTPVGVDDAGDLLLRVRGRIAAHAPSHEAQSGPDAGGCCGGGCSGDGCGGSCGSGGGCGGACGGQHGKEEHACACGH